MQGFESCWFSVYIGKQQSLLQRRNFFRIVLALLYPLLNHVQIGVRDERLCEFSLKVIGRGKILIAFALRPA